MIKVQGKLKITLNQNPILLMKSMKLKKIKLKPKFQIKKKYMEINLKAIKKNNNIQAC